MSHSDYLIQKIKKNNEIYNMNQKWTNNFFNMISVVESGPKLKSKDNILDKNREIMKKIKNVSTFFIFNSKNNINYFINSENVEWSEENIYSVRNNSQYGISYIQEYYKEIKNTLVNVLLIELINDKIYIYSNNLVPYPSIPNTYSNSCTLFSVPIYHKHIKDLINISQIYDKLANNYFEYWDHGITRNRLSVIFNNSIKKFGSGISKFGTSIYGTEYKYTFINGKIIKFDTIFMIIKIRELLRVCEPSLLGWFLYFKESNIELASETVTDGVADFNNEYYSITLNEFKSGLIKMGLVLETQIVEDIFHLIVGDWDQNVMKLNPTYFNFLGFTNISMESESVYYVVPVYNKELYNLPLLFFKTLNINPVNVYLHISSGNTDILTNNNSNTTLINEIHNDCYHDFIFEIQNIINAGYSESNKVIFLGIAADGNPIFGPYFYTNKKMESIEFAVSSYLLNEDPTVIRKKYNVNGNQSLIEISRPTVNNIFPLGVFIEDYYYNGQMGNLDEFNGRRGYYPGFGETYAYHVTYTSENSFLQALSNPDSVDKKNLFAYPYIKGKYFHDSILDPWVNRKIPDSSNYIKVADGILEYFKEKNKENCVRKLRSEFYYKINTGPFYIYGKINANEEMRYFYPLYLFKEKAQEDYKNSNIKRIIFYNINVTFYTPDNQDNEMIPPLDMISFNEKTCHILHKDYPLPKWRGSGFNYTEIEHNTGNEILQVI